MYVDDAKTRNVNHVLRNDLTVADDDHEIRGLLLKLLDDLWPSDSFGLLDA